MERVMSQEERIRRAEEIYNRRKLSSRSKGFKRQSEYRRKKKDIFI